MKAPVKIALAVCVGLLSVPAGAEEAPGSAPPANGSSTDLNFLNDAGSAPAAPANPASAAPPANTQPAAAAPAAGAPPAAAEAAAPTEGGEKKPGNRLVEEIVVTAQKREERLMDVPISIQAFSAEGLDARGVTDSSGLMKAVPGLDVAYQAGFATVFLRGIGTEAFLTADPSIASYIDGVYYSFTPSIIQDFGAVERVEVLKGPQGTLFGRNAVGGAINTITKNPDFTGPQASLQTSYGNFNTLKERAYLNVPVTDRLAMNVSLIHSSGDSYMQGSTIAGHDLNKEVSDGVRFKLRWMPIDELDIIGGLVHTEANLNGAFPSNLKPTILGTALGITPAQGYVSNVDTNLYMRNQLTTIFGQITAKLPWLDIKLLGNRQRIQQPFNYDFDGSVKPYVSFDIPVNAAAITEGEVQLISNQGSPFSNWLTFTGGMYFYRSQQGFNPIDVTVGHLDPTNLAAAGITLPSSLQSLLNTALSPILPNAPLYDVQSTGVNGTNSLSEYLQLTGKINDYISLTFGGRWSNEYRSVISSTDIVKLYDPLSSSGYLELPLINWTMGRYQDGTPIELNHTTKGFKPKISIDTHPFGDDTLVYISAQEAEKAHSYNSYAIYLPPEYVQPEKTRAYELGIKTTLFDNTTRFSTAAFLYKIKNLQTQFVSLINGGAVSFENAPGAQSKGLDFDVTSELFPSLIDGLALTANGCFLMTRFTSYPNAAGYDTTTDLFSHSNDYTGHQITRSPRFTGSLSLVKTVTMPGGPLELGGDVYYNSGYYYTATNDARESQVSYYTLGLRLSYLYEPWGIRTTMFGRNVTNTFYTAGLISTDFGANYTVAAPSMYGLKLDWNF